MNILYWTKCQKDLTQVLKLEVLLSSHIMVNKLTLFFFIVSLYFLETSKSLKPISVVHCLEIPKSVLHHVITTMRQTDGQKNRQTERQTIVCFPLLLTFNCIDKYYSICTMLYHNTVSPCRLHVFVIVVNYKRVQQYCCNRYILGKFAAVNDRSPLDAAVRFLVLMRAFIFIFYPRLSSDIYSSWVWYDDTGFSIDCNG